ncbi:MAG: protein translocase subunit SecF [Minisyncoccia bacterium]
MINFIGKRNIFFIFSGVLVLISIIFIIIFGFETNVDFKGGTKWDFSYHQAINKNEIDNAFKEIFAGENFSVNYLQDKIVVRLPLLNEEEHHKYLNEIQNKLPYLNEASFFSIGPSISAAIIRKAILAIVLVLVGISGYIAWAFRKVSKKIKSWKYGVVTLLTLLHDVSIPAGMLAILGKIKGVEIDSNFIVALLTVMGFSVHDTIVVFDRIRENLLVYKNSKETLDKIFNFSINETLTRSINTSLTLFLVLFVLLILGPSNLFYFILTILVGTIFGTYSSICIASPLLYLWSRDE